LATSQLTEIKIRQERQAGGNQSEAFTVEDVVIQEVVEFRKCIEIAPSF
jgi:hypothetical protein